MASARAMTRPSVGPARPSSELVAKPCLVLELGALLRPGGPPIVRLRWPGSPNAHRAFPHGCCASPAGQIHLPGCLATFLPVHPPGPFPLPLFLVLASFLLLPAWEQFATIGLPMSRGAVSQVRLRHRPGTVSAAKNLPFSFRAMSDHIAPAVGANRGNGLNSSFKAVKDVSFASGNQLKALVVFVPAHITTGHASSSQRRNVLNR